MQHQIDLLQAELEKYKKIGDKQRQVIKKLSVENDDLKPTFPNITGCAGSPVILTRQN